MAVLFKDVDRILIDTLLQNKAIIRHSRQLAHPPWKIAELSGRYQKLQGNGEWVSTQAHLVDDTLEYC
jgi:hypothetical protein